MEVNLSNSRRFPALCFAFGIRRMAGGSALISPTQKSIPTRSGKWTQMGKIFTASFRTGKSGPSTAAAIGRRTAITIIFWRDVKNAQAIWVMPERRSIFRRRAKSPSRLTSGPLRFNAPITSSDGKRLFFLGEEARVELMRYDLQARRFDSYLPGFSAGPVDFSRDRKWMAYVSYPDMTLWRSRLDGSDKMQLTFPPMRAYELRWSPDGSQIVFTDVRFDSSWKIYLLSSSGGSPEVLSQTNTSEADATWTPDGKSIVFGKTDKIDIFSNANVAIYRLDLKTRRVSSIPGTDGLFSPRVSPDGRYISALTFGQTKLMLFDTNANRWSSLVEGEQIGYNEWSHDGKYVYMRE